MSVFTDARRMMRSMTAYARSNRVTAHGQLTWELRSVNQRYLDVSLRLPEEFRALESDVRARVRERLARGKLEVGLKFHTDPAAAASGLQLNDELAASLLHVLDELATKAGAETHHDLVALLDWPGLVIQQTPDYADAHAAALAALDEALDALLQARATEGAAIADMLGERLDGIESQLAVVREHLPKVREQLESRFRERLEALDVSVEPGRVEQELVMHLQKLDVDEELDRLATHVAEARRVMALDEPVGRRLDFLMQEFNREANTLASKATVAETTRAAVELKVLIEQMREQVQNVE